MLQAGLQDLINAEATERIGAAPHERTPERTTRRNGTRPKTLATPAGEVDLAIPKLREGSFFPSLLSPRRRVDMSQMNLRDARIAVLLHVKRWHAFCWRSV